MPQSASTSSMTHFTQSHFAQPTHIRSPSLPCAPTQGRGRTQCVGWELSLRAARKLKGSTGTSCMGWPISCYPFIPTPLRIRIQQHTYFKSNFCSKLRLSQTGMTHRLWLGGTVTENIILIKNQTEPLSQPYQLMLLFYSFTFSTITTEKHFECLPHPGTIKGTGNTMIKKTIKNIRLFLPAFPFITRDVHKWLHPDIYPALLLWKMCQIFTVRRDLVLWEIWVLSIHHLMQALVIAIPFWKESSFSECEEADDQQGGSIRPRSATGQRGGPQGHLGNLVPSVWEW